MAIEFRIGAELAGLPLQYLEMHWDLDLAALGIDLAGGMTLYPSSSSLSCPVELELRPSPKQTLPCLKTARYDFDGLGHWGTNYHQLPKKKRWFWVMLKDALRAIPIVEPERLSVWVMSPSHPPWTSLYIGCIIPCTMQKRVWQRTWFENQTCLMSTTD